jgi:hypothetical protein
MAVSRLNISPQILRKFEKMSILKCFTLNLGFNLKDLDLIIHTHLETRWKNREKDGHDDRKQ